MTIGIIVYSQTGNTLSVAEKLEQSLKENGYAVTLERILAENDTPRASAPMSLTFSPDTTPYDTIIFASPVQAFSLCPVMKQYLAQVSDLSGKKVCCFVTQHLKKPWMGGNHAVKQIKSACESKGAPLSASGVVNWSGPTRDNQIADIVNRLSHL